MEVNACLCAEFLDQEISNALFWEATGLDGFPSWFFQWNWAMVRTYVINVVKEFIRMGTMPDGVNDTLIVLIPKVPSPVKLIDFWSISLCNPIYKIIAKSLVNRLRPLLDGIISPT